MGMRRDDAYMHDLRPCPFCGQDRPERVTLRVDPLWVIFVRCPECGCIGPKPDTSHPPETVEHLWNLRYEQGGRGLELSANRSLEGQGGQVAGAGSGKNRYSDPADSRLVGRFPVNSCHRVPGLSRVQENTGSRASASSPTESSSRKRRGHEVIVAIIEGLKSTLNGHSLPLIR